jgi:hypothetical protein
VLDEQLPQDLVQIGSMIPAGAAGQGHNVGVRGLLAVLAPSNLQARTVEMGKAGRQAQTRGGRRRSEPVECRHPGGKEAIHGTPEGIIMERCGGNTGRKKAGGGLRLETPGDAGERLMDHPQAIAPHRCDGFTPGEVSHGWVLLGRAIEDSTKAQFVDHARDKAEMVHDLATLCGWGGHNNPL